MAEVWTPPVFDVQNTGAPILADTINDIGNSVRFLKRVAYVEFTGDVNVTATTPGTANQIVSSGAITYENVPHLLELSFNRYISPAGTTFFLLRDGTTIIGTVARYATGENSGNVYIPVYRTPTAASHTYNFAAYVSAGTGTVNAGSGGAAGDATTDMPGFIAVYRIPT